MVLVSACLAGFPCRYDGRAVPHEKIIALVEAGQAVPVCPETRAGLPVPREACEIVEGCGGRRVMGVSGRDYTREFARGAEEVLSLCRSLGITEAVLKSASPSCGSRLIHDGSFSGRRVPGEGFTAALLRLNGISVIDESAL